MACSFTRCLRRSFRCPCGEAVKRGLCHSVTGTCEIIDSASSTTVFDTDQTDESTVESTLMSLSLSDGADWLKDYLAEAKEHFDRKFAKDVVVQDTMRNYTLIKTLGSGSFGKVILVSHNADDSKPLYAIKILNKEKVIKTKQVSHTLNEKKILQSVSSPFIVKLIKAFKDTTNLYMVMEFASGGELFTLIRKKGRLPEEWAQFYSFQVSLALQYLHYCSILYRDIKPENILIDSVGYCKLADLGFAKKAHFTWTLCGTPQYLAPEMILNKGYGKSVDYWGLGILIYEMIAGYVPFDHKTPIKLYEMIVECKVSYPTMFKSNSVDLLSKLIEPDVTKRYGNLKNGAMDIIGHQWYAKVDCRKILTKCYKAPWIPCETSLTDGSNFDRQKEESIKISKVDKYPNEFADF